MRKARYNKKLVWAIPALILFASALFILPFLFERSYSAAPEEASAGSLAVSTPVFSVTHLPTPTPMKAIYMTECVATTKNWRVDLENFIKTTELNALVIDIKDYSGKVSFEAGSPCYVKDMREFIAELHKNNIYVIGRITVFQDPDYAKLHPELAVKSKSTGGVWQDHKGLAFIDVGATPYWQHVVDIAKQGYTLGFDEVNFDYIRYPSDGNMQDALYSWTVGSSTKAEMLESFFSYLHDNLGSTGLKTSADLFGLVTLARDDMGIGQVLERALPYFDYIDPMVYPSHFAQNTGGFGDPSTHPYEIVKYSMSSGHAREQAWDAAHSVATSTPSKLRPWLQDFNLGANYGVPEVQAQIKATYDSGLTSWLFWNAGNRYTTAAYSPENND